MRLSGEVLPSIWLSQIEFILWRCCSVIGLLACPALILSQSQVQQHIPSHSVSGFQTLEATASCGQNVQASGRHRLEGLGDGVTGARPTERSESRPC